MQISIPSATLVAATLAALLCTGVDHKPSLAQANAQPNGAAAEDEAQPASEGSADQSDASEEDEVGDWVEVYADPRDTIGLDQIGDEVRRRLSKIGVAFDPSGRHNLQEIQRFTIKPGMPPAQAQAIRDDRHAYSREMIEVMNVWIDASHAATLRTVIEQQEKDLEDAPTYQLFRAYLLSKVPSGADIRMQLRNTRERFEKAIALADEFASAHYEYANFQRNLRSRYPRAALEVYDSLQALSDDAMSHVNKAVELRPAFADAWMLRARWRLLEEDELLNEDFLASIADCKKVIESGTQDEYLVLDAVSLYVQIANELKELGELLNYIKTLREKLGDPERADYDFVMHARLLYFEALTQIGKEEFEAAIDTGRQAVKVLEKHDPAGKRSALLQYGIRSFVVVSAYNLRIKATSDAELRAQYVAEREQVLRNCVEMDLQYLDWDVPEKSSAVIALADRLDGTAALEALRDYDQRAERLKSYQRAVLRAEIDELKMYVNGEVPLPTWQARGPEFLISKLEELVAAMRNKPDFRFNLNAEENFEVLLTCVSDDNAEMARLASESLGFAAVMDDTTDEQKVQARAGIYACMENHGLKLSTGDDKLGTDSSAVSVASGGVVQLNRIGGMESARLILKFMEASAPLSLPAKAPGVGASRDVQNVFRTGFARLAEIAWPDPRSTPREIRRIQARWDARVSYPINSIEVYREIADVVSEHLEDE